MAQHFSTLPITRKKQVDADTQLRDFGTPITATTQETAIAQLRWHRRGEFKLAIDSMAHTFTPGTDFWTISVEVANTAADPFVQVASTVLAGDVGTHFIPLSGELINQALTGEADPVIRVVATLTGAAGALDYSAYLC